VANLLLLSLLALVALLALVHGRSQKRQSAALNRQAAESAAALAELVGGPPEPKSFAISGEVEPIHEEPKALTALDAPMIQARLEKLGLMRRANHHEGEELRRTVLDQCQRGGVGLWWQPLAKFSKAGQSRVGITAVDASAVSSVGLAQTVAALSKGLEEINVRLAGPQDEDGNDVGTNWSVGAAGEAGVRWTWGSRSGAMTITVHDGALDVPDFVRSINGLLLEIGLGHRLVLLAPAENDWCTVLAEVEHAERAAGARWGQILVPAAG